MSMMPPEIPFALEPVVSEEKLFELLRYQTEYAQLDFKRTIDLASKKGTVEFVKDVGAMHVLGGYIVGGVDEDGKPCDGLAGVDPRAFDEASLADIVRPYLPEPVRLLTNWFADVDGHAVVLIYVAPHPAGYVAFEREGAYGDGKGGQAAAFRKGDIYWRQGTKSVRASQDAFETIIERRVAAAREVWQAGREETIRRELEQIRAAYASREIAAGPVGALTIDLDVETLTSAMLDLARQNDVIPLQRLLRESVSRARDLLEQDDFEEELGVVLDKLVCLAATFLEYELYDWFGRVIDALGQIYALGFRGGTQMYDYNVEVDPTAKPPRLWLLVMERVYALGGLAASLRQWDSIRQLALHVPEGINSYYPNWIRHGITMASRAHFIGTYQGEGKNMLSLARQDTARLACLRPGVADPEDDEILTSLAQFDILSNLAAIAGAQSVDGKVFYPSFARFRNERVEPIIDRLLKDDAMRQSIFPLDDADLAIALRSIDRVASKEGFSFNGFWGFRDQDILTFIEEHYPDETQAS